MVVYIASRSELPLIPFRQEAPAFNVAELNEAEKAVRKHFSLPHIQQAGSHTFCGCGFNEGREHSQVYDDPAAERVNALRSSLEFVKYIREFQVEEIYSCWSGDEAESKEFAREISPQDLLAQEFFFREREFFRIKRDVC
jgi:hypothetical protein